MKMFKTSIFLLLLLFTNGVYGEIFNTTRLEQVKVFDKSSVKICLQSLASNSSSSSKNVQVVVRLMVQSTANFQIFTAGNATIVGLQPYIWHEVTLKHASKHNVHVLDATMGERVLPFHKTSNHRWVTSYSFKEILLLTKGAVEIIDCSDNVSTEASTNPVTTARPPTTVGKGIYHTTTLPSPPKGTTVVSTTTETPRTTMPVLPISPKTTTQDPGTDAKLPVPTKGDPDAIEGEDASSKVNTSKTNLPLIVGVVVGLFVLVCVGLLLLRKCKRRGNHELPTSTAVLAKNEQRKDYKSVPN